MADNKYIYAVARIRALELGLLNDSFIEQLIASPDVQSAQRLLNEKGWDENLTLEEEKIWKTMMELGVDMKVFDVLTLPNLYHNLKAAIKEVTSPDKHSEAFFKGTGYDEERINKIIENKDYKELPEHMRKIAQEAYESYMHSQDGQLCDVMIDKACLEAIAEAGKNSSEEVVRDYAKTAVAVTNIKIAARCARTGKSADFAGKAIAKSDAIDAQNLAKAAAGGMEKLLDYLKKGSYKNAAEAISKSPSAFECWCDNEMIRTMKPQKKNPFTIGPLFAYVIARENEIKTVRIVLTGKSNGLSSGEIRERVREMYG